MVLLVVKGRRVCPPGGCDWGGMDDVELGCTSLPRGMLKVPVFRGVELAASLFSRLALLPITPRRSRRAFRLGP